MGRWIVLTIWMLPALMAGSALALVMSATSLVSENLICLPAPISLSIFFGVWGAYILNALTSNSPEDRINKPLRQQVSPRTKLIGTVAAWLFLFVAAGCFLSEVHSRADLGCAGTLALFAVGYWDRPPFRWAKSVPYLKSFWVAGAWTYGAMYLGPHFSLSPSPNSATFPTTRLVASVGFILFAWLLLDTLLLDWKDKRGDRLFGIKTLPQIFSGPRGAMLILTGAVSLTLLPAGGLNLPPLVQRALVATGLGAILFWSLALIKSSSQTTAAQKTTDRMTPVDSIGSDEFYFGCATMAWRYVLYGAVVTFFSS